jgi:hypothetical protein
MIIEHIFFQNIYYLTQALLNNMVQIVEQS